MNLHYGLVTKVLHVGGMGSGIAITSYISEKMELGWGRDFKTYPCTERKRKRKERNEE